MSEVDMDLRGATILVVDDVPDNLDILCRALERAEYDVLVATSGVQALDIASRARPELILLDVMMPGLDGYATCRKLKENPVTCAIPIIFLTALDQTDKIVEGFRAGGVDYITKPFNQEEVLVRINTHLERTRLASELVKLNAELEKKVEERTRALLLRLKELEGKDRITEHLLTYHPLEETLGVVLAVIAQIIDLDRATIYLDQEAGPSPVASMSKDGQVVGRAELAGAEVAAVVVAALTKVSAERKPIFVSEASCAIVPVSRGDSLLGFIQVDRPQELDQEELRILNSFSLQAAVAISDALVQQDMGKWQDQFEDVLNVEEDIDLDDLAGNLEL